MSDLTGFDAALGIMQFVHTVWQVLEKISVPLLLSGVLGLAFLLFSPLSWRHPLGLALIDESTRTYLGVSFWLSIVLLLSRFLSFLGRTVRDWRARSKLDTRRLRLAQSLSSEEKEVLHDLVVKGQCSVVGDYYDPVLRSLVMKEFLVVATNAAPLHDFPFLIQPWAIELLKRRPELLEKSADGVVPLS